MRSLSVDARLTIANVSDVFRASFSVSYCIRSSKTCRGSTTLLGHVSRLKLNPRRDLLTLKSRWRLSGASSCFWFPALYHFSSHPSLSGGRKQIADSRTLEALSGLFPIDDVLERWLRYKATESALYKSTELSDALTFKRFSHQRIDDLFSNPSSISADKGAKVRTSLAHYLFVPADRDLRNIVSGLPCSPQEENTDPGKYNSTLSTFTWIFRPYLPTSLVRIQLRSRRPWQNWQRRTSRSTRHIVSYVFGTLASRFAVYS